jgi:hypothetical protein
MGAARRQSQAMMAQGARQWIDLWTGALSHTPPKTRKKRR